jgi:ADP-ribose pyrophosphatase YjhB (NUDIX family)
MTAQDELMSSPRVRVAAHVLRQRQTWELLVFEQAGRPQAGTQIPAGGVHLNETHEQAVLREVHEETGLENLFLRTELATEDKRHPLTGQPRRTTFFVIGVEDEIPNAWEHRVSGDGIDDGMVFVCRFMPLPLRRSLADHQDAWLGLIDERFATIQRDETR